VPHHEVVSFDIGMASGLDLGSNVAKDVLKLVEKAPTIGTNELRRKEKEFDVSVVMVYNKVNSLKPTAPFQ
jgi:hypothetical protein